MSDDSNAGDEAPVSIASLRSRFESLAAAASSSSSGNVQSARSLPSNRRQALAPQQLEADAPSSSRPPVFRPSASTTQAAPAGDSSSLRVPPTAGPSSATAPGTSARRAAPTVQPSPRRPSPPAAAPPSDDGSDSAEQPAASVKALRERFATSSALAASSTPALKSGRADIDSRSRQSSSASSGRAPSDGSSRLEPGPLRVIQPVPSRPAAPPPPLSRSSSPIPPVPDRSAKPVFSSSPAALTPVLARSPSSTSLAPAAALAPSRSGSATPRSPASSGSSITPIASVPPDISPLPGRPQLPARKATVSGPAAEAASPIARTVPTSAPPPLPPPLPGNKPVAAAQAMSVTLSTDGVVSPPPRLPERPRAQTVSRVDGPPLSSTPPRLPTRTATLAVGSPSRVTREIAPAIDGYQPPPPPTRHGTGHSGGNGFAPTASPRRPTSSGAIADRSSDDDEDEDPSPIAGYTPSAQRALDDYPDATQANRRPPAYVPDCQLRTAHQLSSFAVFGRVACVGHHHVRVYDTMLSDEPLFAVDLKDTGLDFRVKEPRVTAMCFRPAARKEDEGRYLWCGTKDGHLWELDVRTGAVTSTKQSVHASAVVYIFRHQRFVLTLEESGKLHVFEVPSESAPGDEPRLVRTLRTSDKITFAKMMRGRLWTASAPPTRSTTNAAGARGPTVRIYDPCGADSASSGGVVTAATSEWAGAVTSGAVMPLDPATIYLGHEGGYVSVWSADDMACLQVLKISSSDILSLEGAGERLWAGNRKGQIHVYDISQRPWITTNLWTAHPDQPVYDLVVDPWSIEHAGKYTVWSASREFLRPWDGHLAVDWIDCQMVERQPAYCSFRPIRILVCTWNIDSAKPGDLTGSIENATFLEQCLHSVEAPDIIVFGFQEVIPLTDKKLTAKTLLFGNKGKEGAGGAVADKVSAAYRQWLDKLQYAVRLAMPADTPYVKVHSESLVGLLTCVFVKTATKELVQDVGITTVKRGIGGIYGNKGAIVARLVVDDTSVCFINAHLAAGQSAKASRNADLAAILEDKAVFAPSDAQWYVHGGDGSGIMDHELVVLGGDLNYRIDQRRESVVSSVQAGDFAFLLEHDQLRKELRTNHAFRLRSFTEPPLAFAPTYKYDPGTHEYDSSDKHRTPAWCDRVLYRCDGSAVPAAAVDGVADVGSRAAVGSRRSSSAKADAAGSHVAAGSDGDATATVERVVCESYRRYEPTVSDHKPVSAGLRVLVKKVDARKRELVRREVGLAWAKREAEMLDRMQAAYAALM